MADELYKADVIGKKEGRKKEGRKKRESVERMEE